MVGAFQFLGSDGDDSFHFGVASFELQVAVDGKSGQEHGDDDCSDGHAHESWVFMPWNDEIKPEYRWRVFYVAVAIDGFDFHLVGAGWQVGKNHPIGM